MKPKRPKFIGRSVINRPPKTGDVANRIALGQSPEIFRMFGVDPATIPPLTKEAAARWVDQLVKHPHAWVVEHAGQLLGEIRLDGVDRTDHRARLAVGLYDPSKLGIGLGRDAIRLVLGYAFEDLGLHRVGLRVVAYNTRAIRCYSACGFVEEGREREAAYVAGKWYDDVMMSILAREFARAR